MNMKNKSRLRADGGNESMNSTVIRKIILFIISLSGYVYLKFEQSMLAYLFLGMMTVPLNFFIDLGYYKLLKKEEKYNGLLAN